MVAAVFIAPPVKRLGARAQRVFDSLVERYPIDPAYIVDAALRYAQLDPFTMADLPARIKAHIHQERLKK